MRNTTGTDVHGIIPSSVITIVINSGGVKLYYTIFNNVNLLQSLQFQRFKQIVQTQSDN